MKTNKALSVSLATLLGASVLLSACGSNNNNGGDDNAAAANDSAQPAEASTKKVTIDFWTFWGSETRRPIIEKIIDDFNKSQDRITVKHTYYPFGDIWTKELAAVAAGNPPDVIVNDINTTAQRADKNQNTNLTEYLKKDDVKGRFFPQLWDTVIYKDEAYALPFTTDTRMMFYNKDHFKEAGLDPEKFPTTWAELEEAAAKLDKKSGDKYTRIGYSPQYAGFDWGSIAMNFDKGLNFFGPDGKPVINDKAHVDAMNYVLANAKRIGQKNLDNFKASFGSKQANPFIAGQVSIWPDATTFYTQLRDYGQNVNYGVAPIPEAEEGSGHYSVGGGFVVEIPKGAKHPDEAWEFMKYLTDKSAQTYWAEKNFDSVANQEAANDPELLKNPVYQAAVDNMKVTKLFPFPVNAPDFLNLINPNRDAAILGQVPPQEALDKAQKDVENLLQQNAK
ncbi:ABC transporter substrate-binding protein [Paenibacillus sacheonensis]|uniref:Extracellular solute-binding protein n=1 Tax=Paenibacillus sacheonensis TaxID=742054 RepID=A0A7X4YPK5_9BACL|nr:ABC transporter substrate-binding protein [Paenibacillus sacheonensis]MBM7565080.1 multiple sugar transport system substrate-binding protein [Paenibacillus sacheonensis]NBC70137.1 extracellular solute-binding protein [Paenibacillus sacheonensis]